MCAVYIRSLLFVSLYTSTSNKYLTSFIVQTENVGSIRLCSDPTHWSIHILCMIGILMPPFYMFSFFYLHLFIPKCFSSSHFLFISQLPKTFIAIFKFNSVFGLVLSYDDNFLHNKEAK